MLKEERERVILNQIKNNGSISIDHLIPLLETSRSTVIRDINDMDRQGFIKKVRGGAVSPFSEVEEPPFEKREDLFIDEKRRIAKVAKQMIAPGETILLNAGTTVYEIAKLLYDISPLYVATNDLMTANVLSSYDNLELIVLGGTRRKGHSSLNGYFTEFFLSKIHADKAFIGVDAVDMKMGPMNFSTEEINTNTKIIQSSKEVILVCDHSKFTKIAFVNFCRFNQINVIITGKETDEETVRQLKENGLQVILA